MAAPKWTEAAVATWIFQGNPGTFPMHPYFRSGEVTWTLNQHRDRIREGDRVFLWQSTSGTRYAAGVVARAVVGAEIEASAEGKVQRRLEEVEPLPMGVVVARETLKGDERLKDLSILRFTQGTQFVVSEAEAEVLEERWREAEGEAARLRAPQMPQGLVPRVPEGEWGQRKAAMYEDLPALEEAWARFHQRHRVLPGLQQAIAGFLAGSMSLEEFRAAFDKLTRGPGSVFGLKSFSGGMFLNALVKGATSPETLAVTLRRVLAVPASVEAARRGIDEFFDLAAALRAGGATGVHPGRCVVFLSGVWALQQPALWPAFYSSGRNALGIGEWSGASGADNYLRFAAEMHGLARELRMDLWELERIMGADATDTPIESDRTVTGRRVWLIAAGEGGEAWSDFVSTGEIAIRMHQHPVGDMRRYASREAIGEAMRAVTDGAEPGVNLTLCAWQFLAEMSEGDEVFVKRGRRELLARGVIRGAYHYDSARQAYAHRRPVEWLWTGKVELTDKDLVLKTLTEIGRYPELVARLEAATGAQEGPSAVSDGGSEEEVTPTLTLEQIQDETFLSGDLLRKIFGMLKTRKNVVLQGAPGTGKTWLADRLAELLTSGTTRDNVVRVQFHQAYGYEDFVRGIRPRVDGGFEVVDGPFVRLCEAARQDDSDVPYVVLIDEINRGNLARIFGELMMLVEHDKRSSKWSTTLAYRKPGDPGERFFVPPNVHIIGTMNTADRSLALVDYALRRRFAFVTLEPGYGEEGFVKFLTQRGMPLEEAEDVCERMREVNREIVADPLLGAGFAIGHSFFCGGPGGQSAQEWIGSVLDAEIGPLLDEYFADRPQRARELRDKLGCA